MSGIEIIILAFGLAMDAFAVAVTLGLSTDEFNLNKSIVVGLYFGAFQAVMPVIGFFVGAWFTGFLEAYSHIIAFAVLGFLGVKMVIGSFNKNESEVSEASVGVMLSLAVATSIDAMAVGVSFAFLYVNIIFAAAAIGVITLVCSAIGVKIGNAFGVRYKNKAEFAGGVVLVLIGIRILVG